MRITKTLIAAAVATTVGGTAFAGGFADEIIEPPIEIIPVDPPAARGSLPGWVIPVAVVAAIVAAAGSN